VSAPQVSRRTLLGSIGAVGLAGAVVAACSGGESGSGDGAIKAGDGETVDTWSPTSTGAPATTAPVDPTFAEPWKSLSSPDVVDFGRAVLTGAPWTVAHAQSRLGGRAPDDAEQALAAAYATDAAEGRFAIVATWQVPASMAGIAGALALLEDQA